MVTQLFQTERQQTAAIDRLRALKLSEFRFEHTWLKVESDLLPSLEHGEIYIASNKDIEREIRRQRDSLLLRGVSGPRTTRTYTDLRQRRRRAVA